MYKFGDLEGLGGGKRWMEGSKGEKMGDICNLSTIKKKKIERYILGIQVEKLSRDRGTIRPIKLKASPNKLHLSLDSSHSSD